MGRQKKEEEIEVERRPKRRNLLWWGIVVAVGVWIGVAVLSANFLTVGGREVAGCVYGIAGCVNERRDAVVVISGGDTAARVRGGVEVYNLGIVDTVIMAGAAADKAGPSNAAVMRDIAMSLGVPEEKILVEEWSENTSENAEFVARIVQEREYESIVLVTSAYHQRRAYLKFRQMLGNDVDILNYMALEGGEDGFGFWWWMSPEGIYLSMREWAGIGVFHLRGR
ncbi:YdcF family protein [Candidatus Saccharibacteria bacterium]|nr:YdcF family protein [Candidatus Saccharibacteria bacterium]